MITPPVDRWWNCDEGRLALAARDVSAILRVCWRRGGISQGKIGALLGGKAQSEISGLINNRGKRQVVDISWFEAIADGLRVPGHLLGLARRDWERGKPLTDGENSSADQVDDVPQEVVHIADIWQLPSRLVGSAVPACTIEEAVMEAADQSAQFSAWAVMTNVDTITIEQLDSDIRQLASAYLHAPPTPLFRRALMLRNRVFSLLEGRQRPSQSQDLYVAAGQLCMLLAWISGDLGQLHAAETQGRTAWLCAELAEHNALRAWVLSTRSKTAFWAGRYREAIDYARQGLDCQPNDTAAVMLACQEADAWAQFGEVGAATAALNVARENRNSITADDHLGGLFNCGTARQGNYAAGVFLRIGQADVAVREAGRALSDIQASGQSSYGTEAQIRISQALGHLHARQPNPEGSVEVLAPVLALPVDQRLDTVVKRMWQVSQALAGVRLAGSTVAAGLREQIEDFSVAARAARELTV